MRVAVTTTADRSRSWARHLQAAGFEPVSLPCIRVEELGRDRQARELARRVGLVVLTSPRAIDVVWPDGGMRGVAVAAVGSATAKAAEAAGATMAAQGRGGFRQLAADLDASLLDTDVAHVGAEASDPEALDLLRSRSRSFRSLAVYRTTPLGPEDDEVEAALFGSPSAVAGWTSKRPLPPLVGALGSTTAAALRREAASTDIVSPETPRVESLVQELLRHLEVRT